MCSLKGHYYYVVGDIDHEHKDSHNLIKEM